MQYEKELQEWEREKERQAVEFTITEKDLGTKKEPKSPTVVSAARTLHQLSSETAVGCQQNMFFKKI